MKHENAVQSVNYYNVINIKSEILFREAEDNFLYFNKLKKAENKLNEALELTPLHSKSNILKGDICFIKGKMQEAFEHYKKAEIFAPNNSKVLASVANCLEAQKDYNNALKYCNKAFLMLNEDNIQLTTPLYELKTSILLKLKRYEEAKHFISQAKNNLALDDVTCLKSHKKDLNTKLKLKKRILASNLQVL